MNNVDCLKICKYIEKAWNSILMTQNCKFVHSSNCVGHVVYSKNSSLKHAIEIVKSGMHFKNAAEYFNYVRKWHMQCHPSRRSWIGKLFTMPIEQLMLLAELNDVE